MTAVSRRQFLAAAAAVPFVSTLSQAADEPTSAKPVKFGLGLVSYNVAKSWDLPTVLRICRATGVDAFEARTTHAHGIEPSLTADQRDRVKKQFADAGVVFWGCGSTCEFHDPNPEVVNKNVEDCKRFAQLVHDLGGKGVKVRPNAIPKVDTVEATCDRIGRALAECGKATADLGVEVWVEVHGRVTQEPTNIKRMMDACGHPAVGACWNSNATDLTDGSIGPAFEMLAPHIKSCHITDIIKSDYPYRDLFARLMEVGYDRYTLCEYGKSFEPKEGEAFLKDYKAKWTELCG